MHLSCNPWEDSAHSRHAAASLAAEEIQVWFATLPPGEVETATSTSLLSPDERRRAERYREGEPRRRFVFSRTLLRQVLGICLNVVPNALCFGYQPRGKPFLSQPSSCCDLRFNVSHSGRLVAIVLAIGREVGVDLESIQRLDDWAPLAARIFSSRELDKIHALPAPLQREAFFNGWTRKEAYLKATGEGLIDDLPSVGVSFIPGQEALLRRVPDGSVVARRWTIREIPLPPGFAGAVAFENDAAL